MFKKIIRGAIVTFVCTLVLATLIYASTEARVYNGVNKGIAWDTGGVEVVGEPGVFVCAYDWSSGERVHNWFADLLPGLTVDC